MTIPASTMTEPRTITNGGGERLTFLGVHEDERGPYIHVRNVVEPGDGPPMHVHHRQDEGLTVERGTIGYQRQGEEPRTAGPGESVVFRAGEVTASGTRARTCSSATAGSARRTTSSTS